MASPGSRFASVFYNIGTLKMSLLLITKNRCCQVSAARGMKNHMSKYYRELYKRRLAAAPEVERHRSEWLNWNYDAEIYAFGKRLKEDFKEVTLKQAFTHRSYIEKERQKRQEMELGDNLNIEDNSVLIHQGEEITTSYIMAYLRHVYPALPEEGISAVCNHLTSVDVLNEVSSNIGVRDLILCSELKPSELVMSETLLAVIGGLARDQGVERAQYFVQDFILTMLVDKDIMEIWEIINPMGMLQDIVTSQRRGDVESRLLYETGRNTVLAVYMVGVYSDQELLGKGFGETVLIAEEMAARDALRNYFSLTLNRPPLPFNKEGKNLEIDFNRLNASLKDFAANKTARLQ